MRALIVQPPFVQLNATYPAVHYLETFLRERGIEAEASDHSIALYRRIFSREGLGIVFDAAERGLHGPAAGSRGRREAEELDRYLSYRPLYEAWIEGIVDFLSGADPAFAHRLAAAAEFPRGARTEALLEASAGRPGPEEAPALATAVLEDLGDFISYTLDPEFGTVRYGEGLARSRGNFSDIARALDESFVLSAFYRPWLGSWLKAEEGTGGPTLLLVSIPFPGCLLGALACAGEARRLLGPSLRVIFGGGYLSTELRGLRDGRIFDYADYLSFDGGYGSLASILESLERGGEGGLYRTMTKAEKGGVLSWGFPEGDLARTPRGSLAEGLATEFPERRALPCAGTARFEEIEHEAVFRLHPDYRWFQPGLYLRPLDSTNPMHRLWSESPWLKYRLAQGCYWRRCAFCDTELDYVASFIPVQLSSLLEAASRAAERHGLYGIHFIDEALPMKALLEFAAANRERAARGERSFHFWGNVRFDASWTESRCEFLAASGLVAVSGGIEVASEAGLSMVDKGFTLPALVKCLVGMRRAGLLVHAYLIYGLPGQDEAGIVESAEIVRQLFAAGLLDSAFWHRFVLTRHSRMMTEWRRGERPELKPIDRGGAFAANDLEFEGETAYEGYGPLLDRALASWMGEKDLDRPFRLAPRKGKREGRRPGSGGGFPKADLIESLVAKAEAELDTVPLPADGRVQWIAGLPRPGKGEGELVWAYRGRLERLRLPDTEEARRLAGRLETLAAAPGGLSLGELYDESGLREGEAPLEELRGRGLVFI